MPARKEEKKLIGFRVKTNNRLETNYLLVVREQMQAIVKLKLSEVSTPQLDIRIIRLAVDMNIHGDLHGWILRFWSYPWISWIFISKL